MEKQTVFIRETYFVNDKEFEVHCQIVNGVIHWEHIWMEDVDVLDIASDNLINELQKKVLLTT